MLGLGAANNAPLTFGGKSETEVNLLKDKIKQKQLLRDKDRRKSFGFGAYKKDTVSEMDADHANDDTSSMASGLGPMSVQNDLASMVTPGHRREATAEFKGNNGEDDFLLQEEESMNAATTSRPALQEVIYSKEVHLKITSSDFKDAEDKEEAATTTMDQPKEGQPKVDIAEPAQNEPSQPEADAQAPTLSRFCTSCGWQFTDMQHKFCGQCGHKRL